MSQREIPCDPHDEPADESTQEWHDAETGETIDGDIDSLLADDDEVAEFERDDGRIFDATQRCLAADYHRSQPMASWLRQKYNVSLPPLPTDRAYLANLFYGEAHRSAQEQAESAELDVAWMGATFLRHRNEARGRYCFNPACLKPLPPAQTKRGRPRLYCSDRCKEAGGKRRQRGADHPSKFRDYRIRSKKQPKRTAEERRAAHERKERLKGAGYPQPDEFGVESDAWIRSAGQQLTRPAKADFYKRFKPRAD
jgi:hypothetical protein